MKKNILLLFVSFITLNVKSQTKLNDAIKERFYDMLKVENVIFDDTKIAQLTTECNINTTSNDYQQLYKKNEKKKLGGKDFKKFQDLCKPCDSLKENEMRKEILTRKFPRPVPDSIIFNKATDEVDGVSLDLLGSVLFQTKNLNELTNSSTEKLDCWKYSTNILIQDPSNYNSFSFEITSKKLLIATIEDNVDIGLPMIKASLANHFSFSNANARSYNVIMGHFDNNLLHVIQEIDFTNKNNMIPILQLWKKYARNKNLQDYFMIDDFDALFIKKNISSSTLYNTENHLMANGGFGIGILSLKSNNKVDFSENNSTQLQLTGYDVIVLNKPPNYVPLPSASKIQSAWRNWSTKHLQNSVTLQYKENSQVNLIFGPVFGEDGKKAILDMAYTFSKINPNYKTIVPLLQIGEAVPTREKDGFVNIPLSITADANVLANLNISPSRSYVSLPIKIYLPDTVGDLMLSREYDNEITLQFNQDFYPEWDTGDKFKPQSVTSNLIYQESFFAKDGNDVSPASISIEALHCSPQNDFLERNITNNNSKLKKDQNGRFGLTVSVPSELISEPTIVTCRFALSFDKSHKTLTSSFTVLPSETIADIPISDPNQKEEDIFSKIDSTKSLDNELISSMSHQNVITALIKNGGIYKDGYNHYFLKAIYAKKE